MYTDLEKTEVGDTKQLSRSPPTPRWPSSSEKQPMAFADGLWGLKGWPPLLSVEIHMSSSLFWWLSHHITITKVCFSSPHKIYTKTNYMLDHKTNLNKFLKN